MPRSGGVCQRNQEDRQPHGSTVDASVMARSGPVYWPIHCVSRRLNLTAAFEHWHDEGKYNPKNQQRHDQQHDWLE